MTFATEEACHVEALTWHASAYLSERPAPVAHGRAKESMRWPDWKN